MATDLAAHLTIESGATTFETITLDPPDNGSFDVWSETVIAWLAARGITATIDAAFPPAFTIDGARHPIGVGIRYTVTGLGSGGTQPDTGSGSRYELDGQTHWMRSPSNYDCICCEGPHVFSRAVITPTGNDFAGLVHQALQELPEGSQVRLAVLPLPQVAR